MNGIKFFIYSALVIGAVFSEDVVKDEELYPVKDGYVQLDQHNFMAALHRFKFVLVFYCK